MTNYETYNRVRTMSDNNKIIERQFNDLGEVMQALHDADAKVHTDGIEVVDMNPSQTTANVTFTVNHGDEK